MSRATPLPRRPRQGGLTLVELLVVVSLLGVLLALAAPSMRELLAAQRVRSIHAALQTDLAFARSETLRRNDDVVIRFGSNATQTCYVVHIPAASGFCLCERAAHVPVCDSGPIELRTVRIERSLGVTLAAIVHPELRFEARTLLPNRDDFTADVASTVRGQLRTQVNAAGLLRTCSPDGSISQVPPCS